MMLRTNRLRLVGLLLFVLAVAGCATVTPEAQLASPTETPLPPPIFTIPAEDAETAIAAATATDQPDPTATPTLPPPATPTTAPPPTPTTQPRAKVVSNDYGPAPEISTDVWLNTDQPLRLEELRDRVVLVDFWTYG